MRLLVCGGRTFDNMTMLHMGMLQVSDMMHEPIEVGIHGDASGADTLAQIWFEFQGIPTLRFPAKWRDINVPGAVLRFGRHGMYNALAGPQRNARMLDEGKPTAFLAMPGGTGTADMVARCRRAGLMGVVVE
jgi:hypothetical protein